MVEGLLSRVKVVCLIALFVSPVLAAGASSMLDRFIEEHHRLDAPNKPAAAPLHIDDCGDQ